MFWGVLEPVPHGSEERLYQQSFNVPKLYSLPRSDPRDSQSSPESVTELVPNRPCATFLVSLDEPGGVSMVVLSSNMGGGVMCHGVWGEREGGNAAGCRWCVVCRGPTLEQGRLGRILHPVVLWTLALGKTTVRAKTSALH